MRRGGRQLLGEEIHPQVLMGLLLAGYKQATKPLTSVQAGAKACVKPSFQKVLQEHRSNGFV